MTSETRYALYHVNTKTGALLRFDARSFPGGSKTAIERQATVIRAAKTATIASWRVRALPEGTTKLGAVTYIPGEDDVDPDSLEEKQDLQGRDQRDSNAEDRPQGPAGVQGSLRVHPEARLAFAATTRGKVAAVRDLKANSLVVLDGGVKVGHWEGAALDAAMEDGTLNPRRIEASAIQHLAAQGIITLENHP